MRQLASIVTIKDIQKMYKKDKIVCATMNENAYEVIVPNTTKIGDRMVFIQEGAILPVKPEYEFLRKRCYKESVDGFVIKPMTMGHKENPDGTEGQNVRSWGLCMGLDECGLDNFTEGTDVTDILEIRKYEPEDDSLSTRTGLKRRRTPKWVRICMKIPFLRFIGKSYLNRHKSIAFAFPTDVISKSDETTIQNYGEQFLFDHMNDLVYVTAKLEGQSFTVFLDYHNGKVGDLIVCSRSKAVLDNHVSTFNNDGEIVKSDNGVFLKCAKKYDIAKKLLDYYNRTGQLLVIQGEQVGEGIQGNIYDLKGQEWFVFTIKDQITDRQLSIEEMINVCYELGLNTVPILEKGYPLYFLNADFIDYDWDVKNKETFNMDSLIRYAEKWYWRPIHDTRISDSGVEDNKIDYWINDKKNKENLWVNCLQHEGIVVRSMDYDKDRNIGFSFKVKNIGYQEKSYSEMNRICRGIKNEF